ncbi:MAG TPA: alpha-L-arabinofuranosidase C-terminal domain-containing protein [Longimicrobiaceae bacterium]|nr:alpha-L-arabinofuranosidase C-terminal domain-containing protein [Longimicrobiaceae bacterium]
MRANRTTLPGALAASLLLAAAPLPAQAPAPASITVDARHPAGAISPMLYGQFIEFMFGGVKGGLTAELLRDRGFEAAPDAIGLPRYWERYPDDRDDDYGLSFARDDSVFYAADSAAAVLPGAVEARHALRVEAGGGVVERHGIYQARIPVRAGKEYRGYLWLRSDGYRGPVGVALEEDASGGRVYAEATIDPVRAGEWARYSFTLRPSNDDPHARFVVLFPGSGRLWVDQASLLPGDAEGGIRAEVEARVRALHPAFLRWPGGNVAQDYHWRWGVGPRDRRPEWVNLSWRGELEPGDMGTAEYVAFSRRVGAEPTVTVNVDGRGATPEEAAAWVEYCNGPVSSPGGARRAADGHPRPFGIRYWEIGNEIWGDWVRGHSDAETYARNFLRYRDAMLAVDSTLRFIAVGDNDQAWNRTVLRVAGRGIDVLAVHHYYGREPMAGDVRNLLAHPLAYERFYPRVDSLARALVPGHRVRLAINEWGLDLPEARQYSILAALYGARMMNVFERSSPLVTMSAVSDLVNGWPGGIIQAARDSVFVTPIYQVNRLWATHLGAERLRAVVRGPSYDTSREGRDVPALDVSASRSADGRAIFLKVVNTDLERAIDATVRVEGATLAPRGELSLIAAGPGARSGFATPDAFAPRREEIPTGSAFRVRLPARSAAVLTLRVAP